MSDRLLTTRQVAALLAVNPETVLRWHRSAKLPGGRRLGTNVLSPCSGAFALREARQMPAEARGHVRKLPSGKWQLRWYDREGRRRSGGAFQTRSEALRHYRDVIEPELQGRQVRPDLTLSELADLYLERHALVRSDRTIQTLRWRCVVR